MTTMFIALAMIEAQVIYALVVAMIALYANHFRVIFKSTDLIKL